MANYTPSTSAKVNYLDNLINEHKDWGSAKLQAAIVEKFGSALKKNYLLQEARAYRESQQIEQPKAVLSDTNRLRGILNEGGYNKLEKDTIIKQVKGYSKDGRKNFIDSEVLKTAAKQHNDWLQSLLKEARKSTDNMTQAKALVFDRLKQLTDQGEYDPFVFMRKVYHPKAVRRDYSEQRREYDKRRRALARERISRVR